MQTKPTQIGLVWIVWLLMCKMISKYVLKCPCVGLHLTCSIFCVHKSGRKQPKTTLFILFKVQLQTSSSSSFLHEDIVVLHHQDSSQDSQDPYMICRSHQCPCFSYATVFIKTHQVKLTDQRFRARPAGVAPSSVNTRVRTSRH